MVQYHEELGLLGMKIYVKSYTGMLPHFRQGDIVLVGYALGYQGTFLLSGDINNFPEELAKYVRNVYFISDNFYKVEFEMVDEPHCFQENYDNFFNRIEPILNNYGFEIVEE